MNRKAYGSTFWLLCLFLVVAVPVARAKPHAVDLAPNDFVLQGTESSVEKVFELAEPSARVSDPTLTLHWRASTMLSLERSTLTVLVDDAPLRSFPLARRTGKDHSGMLVLRLPKLDAGFHRLGLRARLLVDGDPCLNTHEAEAWLRVEGGSGLRWERRPEPVPADSFAHLARTVRAWRDGRLHVLRAPAMTTASDRAFVELEHLARELTLDPRPNEGGAAVILGTLEAMPGGATFEIMAEQVSRNPGVRGGAVMHEQAMLLLGEDGHALLDLVRLLREPEARALCDGTECWLGPLSDTPPSSRPEGEEQHSLKVLDVGGMGYPRGWTARGAGTHRFDLHWQRPKSARVRGWPTLTLILRHPQDGPLDASRSRLAVELNGVPLATYGLEETELNVERAKIRVPPEYWEEAAWHFSIRVHLRADEAEPCEAVDHDLIWLVIGPGSHLDIPRDLERRTSIAGFAHQADLTHLAAHPARGQLTWLRPQDLTGPELRGASLMLSQLLGPDPERLRVVDNSAQCRSLCVAAMHFERDQSPLASGPDGLLAPRSDGSLLRIPTMLQGGLALLHRADAGQLEDASLRLWVDPRRGLPSDITLPDLRAFDSSHALFAQGRWRLLPTRSPLLGYRQIRRAPDRPTMVPPVRTPLQARLLARINALWAITSFAAVVGLLYWFRRGRRRSSLGVGTNV